jgi:hypothetical protein
VVETVKITRISLQLDKTKCHFSNWNAQISLNYPHTFQQNVTTHTNLNADIVDVGSGWPCVSSVCGAQAARGKVVTDRWACKNCGQLWWNATQN